MEVRRQQVLQKKADEDRARVEKKAKDEDEDERYRREKDKKILRRRELCANLRRR